jgi:hypothetical protein
MDALPVQPFFLQAKKRDDTCLFPFKNAHLNVFDTSMTIIARKIGIVLIS